MENFVRENEIIVKCKFELGKIKNLFIKECTGNHTIAHIEAELKAGGMELAFRQLCRQHLIIEVEKDGWQSQLFSGVVSKIKIKEEADYEIIYIEAFSFSWLLDMEKKSRSFQEETSILNLLQKISEENAFSILCSEEDKVTKAPFIQYRETDWEFLKRLSSHLHAEVYPASAKEDRRLYIGLQKQGIPVELKALSEKWCMDSERANQMDFKVSRAAYYKIDTYQVLHIGQNVRYQNKILWVAEAEHKLCRGMLHCTYKLAEMEYYILDNCYNPYIKGVSLTGTVLERRNETIKVHLDIDKKREIDNAYSYLWLPEHGNMLYCMPEEGSRIRLLVMGEDERNAIGIQCMRQNGEACRETQIVDNRWFITTQNKKMTLQPDIIELSGDKGKSEITLEDGHGSSFNSCENILIQAKGNIIIKSETVSLSAPGEVTAIKRELDTPAVVNICYNLDAMGKQTSFRNLQELQIRNISASSGEHNGNVPVTEKERAKEEEEKRKLRFEIQEWFRQERKDRHYELGAAIVNVISAIPQPTMQDRISQIAIGFRPIIGVGKHEA